MKNIRLFPARWILTASILGGIFGGLYMVYQNLNVLEKKKLARKVLFYGSAAYLSAITFLFFYPYHIPETTYNVLIPLIFAVGVYLLAYKTHGQELKTHFKNGGKKASGWVALGVTVVSFLLVVGYVTFLIALVAILNLS